MNLTLENLPSAVHQLTDKLDTIERLLQGLVSPSKAHQDLMNINQASEFLNLSKQTIYQKVSSGTLPFMKRSKRLYFSREELTAYLKAGRKKTNQEIEDEASDYLVSTKRGQND